MTDSKAGTQFFKERLVSLDVFRGAIIAKMILGNNPGSWRHIYPPLQHAAWNGWTYTDLGYPFFLFIVGIAIVYALSSKKSHGASLSDVYIKMIRRTLILFGLGLFLNLFPNFDFIHIRIPGVLQRIAICYFVVSVIFLHFKLRGQIIWTAAFMLAYWALMEFVPFPGGEAGSYIKNANLSNWFDSVFFHGFVFSYTAPWDPEGVISTLPCFSTTLFGVLTGHLLKSKLSGTEKTVYMLIVGNVLFLLGNIWGNWMPINKSIWTCSYALLTTGLALITLGIVYFIADVKRYRKFTKPFIVYSSNSIAVYVLANVVAKIISRIEIDGSSLKNIFFKTFFTGWIEPVNGSLLYGLFFVLVMYLAMLYLYKKKIFIKI